MFIENIADYLQKLKKRDIKPEIFTVFEFPDDLTILEILNSIGYRLANLFGFVKINTSTETIDEDEAAVNVSGDVDNLNFDFKIPRGKTGPQGPAGPGVATGGTTGQVLAKKSDANFDTEWIDVPNSGGLTKTILWTNPNPKNEMAGTQLVMSDFITNYKLITIEYLLSTTLQKVITTVYNKNTDFTETRLYYYDGYRDVKLFGQRLFVNNGWNLKTNVSDSTQVIPLRIVAYD